MNSGSMGWVPRLLNILTKALNKIIYKTIKPAEDGFLSEEQAQAFKSIFWVFRNDIEYASDIPADIQNFIDNDPRVKKFRFGKSLE